VKAAERMPESARAKHARISSVPCPKCGAAEGAPCRVPNGKTAVVPHQARRSAAADAGIYVPGGAP